MKYDEIVKQFQNNIFGTLTTIRSNKEPNKIWFLGREIQELLEFVNLTQVIKAARLKPNEKFILTKALNSEFWNEFATTQKIGAKIRSITFVSESGLYKLIMRSNKPEAKKFADWVTEEILPTLRKGVEEEIIFKRASAEIGKHLDVEHQKYESKRINERNINTVGVAGTINYNRNSCLDHSGIDPIKLKRMAKKCGIPASKRNSGKEVLRLVDMPSASSMSFTDSLVSDGISYEKALKVSVGAGKELFRQLLEIGVIPKELDK